MKKSFKKLFLSSLLIYVVLIQSSSLAAVYSVKDGTYQGTASLSIKDKNIEKFKDLFFATVISNNRITGIVATKENTETTNFIVRPFDYDKLIKAKKINFRQIKDSLFYKAETKGFILTNSEVTKTIPILVKGKAEQMPSDNLNSNQSLYTNHQLLESKDGCNLSSNSFINISSDGSVIGKIFDEHETGIFNNLVFFNKFNSESNNYEKLFCRNYYLEPTVQPAIDVSEAPCSISNLVIETDKITISGINDGHPFNANFSLNNCP